MFAIAKLAMRSHYSAAALAAATLLASVAMTAILGSLGVPLVVALMVISTATICLTLLRHGINTGLKPVGFALVMLAVFALIVGLRVIDVVFMVAILWLPTLIAAAVLRTTVRLDLSLATLAGLAALVIVLVYWIYPDQSVLWRDSVALMIDGFRLFLEQGGSAGLEPTPAGSSAADSPTSVSTEATIKLEAMRDMLHQHMTLAMVVSMLLLSSTALLQARYWQARLYNPGGFGEEFRGLRFGHILAGIAVLVCAMAAINGSTIAIGLSLVAVCLFLFQGLALLHALVKTGRLNQGWLVATYVLLVVLQSSVILVAALGVVDNWLKISRTGQRPKP